MTHKNIYEAMLAVMNEVGYVQKDGEIRHGANYKFASEAAFIQALRPSLMEHGIIVYPAGSSAPTVWRETYETNKGGTMNLVTIRQGYKFHHVPSGTEIYVQAHGQGADSGDKAIGKAMTNALKYALRQGFLIETGDDPDYTPSESQKRADAPEAMFDNMFTPDQLPGQMTQDEFQSWKNAVIKHMKSGKDFYESAQLADTAYYDYLEKKNG